MVSTKKRRLFGQKSGLLFQKGQLRLPLRQKCIRNIIICRCTDIEPGWKCKQNNEKHITKQQGVQMGPTKQQFCISNINLSVKLAMVCG